MHRLMTAAVLGAAVTIGLVLALSASAEAPPVDQAQAPVVVAQKVHAPERVRTFRQRFTPNATPSPAEVIKIMALERQRWGGPSIYNRIRCESGFQHNATNGQYRGLGQIGPWWNHAWPQTPRRVRKVVRDRVRLRVVMVTQLSDGSKRRKVLRRFTGIRRYIYTGKLPQTASPYHGWAAIRVVQRAAAGVGPSTYWECDL